MPVRVQCSAGHLMMVPDHRAGTVLRCANCGIDVHVPAAGGIAGKEVARPRITTPVIARNEVKPSAGTAAKQSPRVAGHSASANSGIGLPALSKPTTKPRVKPPPAAETSPADAVKKPDETAIVARKPAPELKPTEVTPTVETPATIPTPAEKVAEIEFTTPVTAPQPLVSKAAPAIDPSTVETVELPPKKVFKPVEEKPSVPAPAVAQESRKTLTGTIIETASERPRKPAELFEIKDEPEPPPAPANDADHEPEPAPPPLTILRGVRATVSQRHTAWQLAAALAATALLSIGPALWEITDFLRSDSALEVAKWAFVLLMFGVVQFASIVLLVQVPDWSSVWIVTLQSLGFAAIYAAVLGLTVITNGDSSLIGTLQLDQQYSSNKAPAWCVCLAATYACIAFFAGRISAKWRKVLRQVQAAEQATAHA